MFLQTGAGSQNRSDEIQLGKPTFYGPESLASLEVVSRRQVMNAEAAQHVSCGQEIGKNTIEEKP